jgi:hypothetical protein
MNGNPYTSSWIGATQQYPIYEYANLLDSNQSNFVTKTSNILHNEIVSTSNILEIHSSNNIAIASNNLQIQINATCNLIYKDADRNTIVRISAQNPQYPLIGNSVEMQFQNVNGNYLTKIIQTGELYVYHPISVIPVGYGAGWWNVENKLSSIIQEEIGLRFDVIGLQATSGTTAITDTAAAATAVATAGGGLAAAGAATGAAGTAIAGGDYGTVALGAAGGALFTVLGYLSYQAQVSSNLTSNGFSNQAAIVNSNMTAAKILVTGNISNICIAKGFINCNIKTPQYISKINTDGLSYQGVELSNIIKYTSNYSFSNFSTLSTNIINTSNYCFSNFSTLSTNIINTSNYCSNLLVNTNINFSNLINIANINTSNFLKKTNILLSNANFQYDGPNGLYYYDLNIEKYVPSVLTNGYKSRAFRISTYVPYCDWRTGNNLYYNNRYINFPEPLTIYMNNNSNVFGISYPNDAYANGLILGKTTNNNIGYWNILLNNYNYIRYLSYVGGDTNIIVENLSS